MKTIEELLKEKDRLQKHLEWGKDILCFDELNWVRGKIKEIKLEIKNLSA